MVHICCTGFRRSIVPLVMVGLRCSVVKSSDAFNSIHISLLLPVAVSADGHLATTTTWLPPEGKRVCSSFGHWRRSFFFFFCGCFSPVSCCRSFCCARHKCFFLCRSGKVGIRSEERRVVVAHERDADRRHNRVVCVFLPGAFITCSDQHRLALLSAV